MDPNKALQRINATASILHDLSKVWTPHTGRIIPKNHVFNKDLSTTEFIPAEGQKTILKTILSGKYRVVFVQFGRQTGKSELANAGAHYKGLLTPGSVQYYFAPIQKQVKEIVWSTERMQTMNSASALTPELREEKMTLFNSYGRKYIEKINNADMRVTWHNGSFIRMDGIDNIDAYRGVTPDLMYFDEFREFRPGALDSQLPAMMTKGGTIVILSTPPPAEGEYTKIMRQCQSDKYPHYKFFQAPTWMNPYQDLEGLELIRQGYIDAGEFDIWRREYCGEFAIGGSRSIFPMVTGAEGRAHSSILAEMGPLGQGMEYHCICDPGSATKGSAFAVLFVAYHPYTKRVFLLDEIYLTDEDNKSVGSVEPLIAEKIRTIVPSLFLDDWIFTYDEAATWFFNEMQDRNYAFIPTRKRTYGKDAGLSAIKDVFKNKTVHVSDNCENLMWEMTNYLRDDRGHIPKKNDHLIDCFRYFFMSANWHYTQKDPAKGHLILPNTQKRWIKPEDDLKAWGSNIFDDTTDDWQDF